MMDRVDRETLCSAVTIKTDTGSKVLPGDKQGLPYEIWAIILSYLSVEDLCRSANVCKTWNDLVSSLDHTKWKDLYLHCTDWRHPYWPLNLNTEPYSWREAYKEKYTASAFWTQTNHAQTSVTCMSVFKRNKLYKTLTVGQGKDFGSLRGALAVANDYDKIIVYPGIYDEQFEMSSKIPLELVGCGELGSVILVVCIEQTAITGRISNLVFRAPWFTNFILKVRAGYLQVDNCIMEDGMVYVQNPGSMNISFCTFRHATVILQHVNASIIQNCEFSQTDVAAITVAGYPKEDRNWTFKAMTDRIMSACTLKRKSERQKSGQSLLQKSAFSTAFTLSTATTNQKYNAKGHLQRQFSVDTVATQRKMSQDLGVGSHDHGDQIYDFDNLNIHGDVQEGAVGGLVHPLVPRQVNQHRDVAHSNYSQDSRNTGSDNVHYEHDGSRYSGKRMHTCTKHAHGVSPDVSHGQELNGNAKHLSDKYNRIQNFVLDCAKYSNPGTSAESTIGDVYDLDALNRSTDGDGHLLVDLKPTLKSHVTVDHIDNKSVDSDSDVEGNKTVKIPALDLHSLTSQNSVRPPAGNAQVQAALRERSLSSSEVSIHTASSNEVSEDGDGNGVNSDSLSTTSSEDSLPFSDNDSEFSSSEESVIMLTYPERHQPRSLSAQKEHVDVASINSQNQSEHIDIIQDNDMKKVFNEVRGCLVHKCRITQCKGAVMVSLQAHAIIAECEINSVGYGIRCIQNSRTVILKNEIHHCRTSGIFMRLAASGLVTGNDIHSNCEAGIDIRKNADPIVQCNRIHHGKRSGIVVLGSGKGQIRNNDIYQNKEAGVYILYRGNPTLIQNQIYSGRAAGIAINEGGLGYIHANVITGNQWGGIDIRHGGDPVIHQNTVCNGMSDGIVIGEAGRGSIENNIITGNAGCAIWVMAAHQPLIHGNEIHSNRDTGISLVNRMDNSHKNETQAMESKNSSGLELWGAVTDDQHFPRQQKVTMTTIEYNKVFHNEGKGISVQFGDAVLVQNNYIHANRSDGIMIDQPLPVILQSNFLTCNSGSGVLISGTGQVDIHGNGIYDNREHGIWCQSATNITENDILGNNLNAIYLHMCAEVKVIRNRIHSPTDLAVYLTEVKRCKVEDNIFFGKGDKTLILDKRSHCSSISNQVLPTPDCKYSQSPRKEQQDLMPLGSTRWLLYDPKPRPHIDTPPQVAHMSNQQTTTITKVSVPADNCERGSSFCVIV